MKLLEEKKKKLLTCLDKYSDEDIMIAFSGGVDSTLLLKAACELADKNKRKVYAVTIHTTLHPMNEIEITKQLAKEIGAIHSIIEVDELQNAGIMNNPVNRCYLCKKYLFTKLLEMAKELGIKTIMDGTNEDDLHVYRPGILALKELNIKSPLAETGITKKEIREIAKEYGLSVAKRPCAPCLATRFPYDCGLSYEKMRKVEAAEEYIKGLGFYNVRLRVHDELAKIEVDAIDMNHLLEMKTEIVDYLKQLGYTYVAMDLEGFRSGSMDAVLDL